MGAVVPESAGGATEALLTVLAALAAFGVVAWLSVRWLSLRRRGLGAGRGKHVQVLERVPLDFKSTLYVVRAGNRTLLVGSGEGGAPRLLTEIPTGEAIAKREHG